jgi:hypothetical protein
MKVGIYIPTFFVYNRKIYLMMRNIMKDHVVVIKFKNDDLENKIEFSKGSNIPGIKINCENGIYFVIDNINFDKQNNNIMKTIIFTEFLYYSAIHNFFNKKIGFYDAIRYNHVVFYQKAISLYNKNLLNTIVENNSIPQLAEFTTKHKEFLINNKKDYDSTYDEFHDLCLTQKINDYIKITIDYDFESKFKTIEDFISTIKYEYCIIE